MTIELSKCSECGSCSIDQLAPRADRYRMMCRVCGFQARFCDTPDEAAEAWNELCEDIGFGKSVRGAIPKDHRITANLGRWQWGHGSLLVAFATEYIPAPALDPLEVLRRCQGVLSTHQWVDQKILIGDIVAILAQAQEAIAQEAK